MAFSPDGKSLASGAKKDAFLLEITPGGAANEFTHIRGHHDAVESLAFSPNGTQLVTENSGSLRQTSNVPIGDISTESRVGMAGDLRGRPAGGFQLGWENGRARQVADGFYTILNAATGGEICRNSQPAGDMSTACISSPDGTLDPLALGERTNFTRRDIAISPSTDEVLIAVSPTGEVQIWDWANQKIRAKLIGWNGGECRSVKFSPDGTLLATTGGHEGAAV